MFWGFSGFSRLQEIFVCYWFSHSHTKHLLMFLYTCPLPSVYLGISWTSKEIWPFSASYITENIGKLELLKIVLFLFFFFGRGKFMQQGLNLSSSWDLHRSCCGNTGCCTSHAQGPKLTPHFWMTVSSAAEFLTWYTIVETPKDNVLK